MKGDNAMDDFFAGKVCAVTGDASMSGERSGAVWIGRAPSPPPWVDEVVGRAHGKVILLGEHAVVYGASALCGAIAAGVQLRAVDGKGVLWVPGRASGGALEPITTTQAGALGQAYRAVVHRLGLDGCSLPCDLVAQLDIPLGGGLGGSAALSVALARALDRVLGLGLDQAQVRAAAGAAEEVFHGRASGLDHTLASSGGFGLFRPTVGFEALNVSPFTVCIGISGRQRATRAQVDHIAAIHRTDSDRVAFAVRRIDRLVAEAARAVRGGDLDGLGAAMNENQRELAALGVSCPELDALCAGAARAGARGAKLTGAGGGGCVVALPGEDDRGERILAQWRAEGFAGFVTTLAGSRTEAALA
jgi:mevalonate kinase